MEKTELPKSLTLTFTATSYLNTNSYFYSYKAGKNKLTVIQIRIINVSSEI